MPGVVIKNSLINGVGVFSTKTFIAGSELFTFSDRLIKINHPLGCDCKICCRCIQIGKFTWLYPKKNSFGWFLNHSCSPNCGIKNSRIVALKNIKKDEEITIDYSTTNTDKKWQMICKCGSKDCRDIIRSVQFLPEKLYAQYKNFMPDYVSKNYKNL